MWNFRLRRDKRLPEWVGSLPFEGDRQTVYSLVQAGANLAEPREMIFCVYATKKGATGIQRDSKQYGWTCSVQEAATSSAGEQEYLIELKQSGYILNLKNFLDDKTSIQSLAKKYGAVYDGWYASV